MQPCGALHVGVVADKGDRRHEVGEQVSLFQTILLLPMSWRLHRSRASQPDSVGSAETRQPAALHCDLLESV
jgi:hypothetical protein